MSTQFVCTVCGEQHDGLGAWAFRRPDYWLGLSDAEQAAGKVSDDLCCTGDGFYFVRSVLRIPIVDGPEDTFEFGIWNTLSEENFNRYVDSFDDEDQSKLDGMFGYLANEIKQFPGSLSLHCDVWPQDHRQRPRLIVQAQDHALYRAQQAGIRFEDALNIMHGIDKVVEV